MKSCLLVLLVLISYLSQAQTTLSLEINHVLGSTPFAFNEEHTNDMNNKFSLTWLQYYMSSFSVIHDGGTETAFDSLYFLVNANESTTILLSENFEGQVIEKIKFGIGVEAPVNNDDPSLWPASHPLSPKFPSMHWGWSAGYRFVVLEGNCGENLDLGLEIHALGNSQYYIHEVQVSPATNNTTVAISLNANYITALAGIEFNQGLIEHGESITNKSFLRNFRGVFSDATNSALSVEETESSSNISIYPNPSTGSFLLSVEENLVGQEFQIVSMDGKQVHAGIFTTSSNQINLKKSGLFWITTLLDNKPVVKRLIVQ